MRRRACILTACLLGAAAAVHLGSRPLQAARPARSLGEALSQVPEWSRAGDQGLGDDVASALDLDDYLYRTYRRGDRSVDLYVGYYYSKKKVGAAHSPLVCYPGQGWEVSGAKAVAVDAGGAGRVRASAMTVTRGDRRDLVIFWFQAYDRTTEGTFAQKLWTTWNRLFRGAEANAFVRVSVPVGGDEEAALRTAESFVRDFYPVFYRYVTGS